MAQVIKTAIIGQIMSTFVNAVEMGALHPDSFYVPDTTDLKPGDFVKVCNKVERFWIRLTTVEGESLIGVVDNHLLGEYGYNIEDRVSFKRENVYDIQWMSHDN